MGKKVYLYVLMMALLTFFVGCTIVKEDGKTQPPIYQESGESAVQNDPPIYGDSTESGGEAESYEPADPLEVQLASYTAHVKSGAYQQAIEVYNMYLVGNMNMEAAAGRLAVWLLKSWGFRFMTRKYSPAPLRKAACATRYLSITMKRPPSAA